MIQHNMGHPENFDGQENPELPNREERVREAGEARGLLEGFQDRLEELKQKPKLGPDDMEELEALISEVNENVEDLPAGSSSELLDRIDALQARVLDQAREGGEDSYRDAA